MRRQIELIGAAWGLGGADPGCAQAPSVLAPALAERLSARGASVVPWPMLAPLAAERRKQAAVGKLCGLLGSAVADAVRRERLPCVLGGDHSCAGGTWTGVARALRERSHGAGLPLGLVWVDAHMDSHTPRTSPSGRLHGMPLAWLLGQDDDPLYGLATGILEARHVCLVGVRSYEREEEARLERLGVRVFMAEEARSRGVETVFDEAIAIATSGTAAFGVSIDLDVVDPAEAPGVATPAAAGLPGAALAAALGRLHSMPELAAIELVEYSPRLDRNGATARIAVELLASALCGPEKDPQVFAHPLEREHP